MELNSIYIQVARSLDIRDMRYDMTSRRCRQIARVEIQTHALHIYTHNTIRYLTLTLLIIRASHGVAFRNWRKGRSRNFAPYRTGLVQFLKRPFKRSLRGMAVLSIFDLQASLIEILYLFRERMRELFSSRVIGFSSVT